MSNTFQWNGMRFLNTRRRNIEALRTLNRADAAKSPHYWTDEQVALSDGTFGVLAGGWTLVTGSEASIILRIPFTFIAPPGPGFRLINFGGTILETPIGGGAPRQFSANLGAIDFRDGNLEYVVRCWQGRTDVLVWARYATENSSEL